MVNKNSANSLDEIPKKKKILYKKEQNYNDITYINAMKERNMVTLKLLIENFDLFKQSEQAPYTGILKY